MIVFVSSLMGCQGTHPETISKVHASRRDSHIGLLKVYAEARNNIPNIIASAIRNLGISFREIQHDQRTFEYRAETISGESITIKAIFTSECGRIDIDVWGSNESELELIRDRLSDAISADIDKDMRALGILGRHP